MLIKFQNLKSRLTYRSREIKLFCWALLKKKIKSIGGKSVVVDEELKNATTKQIVSKGFNQWDEEWENGTYSTATGVKSNSTSALQCIRGKNFIKCLPDTQYYIALGDYTGWAYVLFYDKDKQYISFINPYGKAAANPDYRNPVTTPSNCGYMTIFMHSAYGLVYKHDICVNISDSARNGEYVPYFSQTNETSALAQKYFPTGMKSAGSVYDEFDFENKKAIQRIGTVDLGTRSWVYVPARKHFYASGFHSYPVGSATIVANLLASGYTTVATTYVYNYAPAYDKCIGMSSAGTQLYMSDQTYTDAAALKAALSGVMINYELAEPIITDITEDLSEIEKIAAVEGGTLDFVSTLDDEGIHVDVPHSEEWTDGY